MKILGSKFWALGTKVKNRRKFCSFCHGVLTGGQNGSIPSRNKKEAMFVTNRQTDGKMDRQTDRVNDKNIIVG